jgi:hypothetical protein
MTSVNITSFLMYIVLTQSSDPTLSGSLEEWLGKAKSSNSLHPSLRFILMPSSDNKVLIIAMSLL